MDYQTYENTFLSVQKDYKEMKELQENAKAYVAEGYVSGDMEATQYEDFKKAYNKLKVKTYAGVSRLKEYFVENNEEFSKEMFVKSVQFFSRYSINERVYVLDKQDYQYLNAEFLEDYRNSLSKIEQEKNEQYKEISVSLRQKAKEFKQKFNEHIQRTENTSEEALLLKEAFYVELFDREDVYKDLFFAQKEGNLIDEVLMQYEIKEEA